MGWVDGSEFHYTTILPYSQLNRLQQIQNCLARAVFKAPKFTHTTPILKSLYWLKTNQRIEYKILSLTYKVLEKVSSSTWLYTSEI